MFKEFLNTIGKDGLAHILVSAAIAFISSFIVGPEVASLGALGLGISKEFIWDWMLKKGTFDDKDIKCDIIGVVLGEALYVVFLILFPGLTPIYDIRF